MINYSEMAALGMGFSRTEIKESTDGAIATKTVYAGHAPLPDVTDATLRNTGWMIRKTIVTTDVVAGITTVVELWGKGSWADRDTIDYNYK